MLPHSPSTEVLEQDHVAACRELLKNGSRSFHVASLILPRAVREPATVLYAFCRVADDAVDLSPGRKEAVRRLRERLDRAYAGNPIRSHIDEAFARVVKNFSIPKAWPEALIEGLEWDANGRRYEDLASLEAYAVRVAGAVGLMMTALMDKPTSQKLARACDLGVAMQLTNICRDVGEDARAGRIYLPTQWLEEAGIDPDAWLADPVFTPAIGLVVGRCLERADVLYERAETGIAQLPMGCRPSMYAARYIYAEIGHQVAANGFDSVGQRTVVSTSRKLELLSKSILVAMSPGRRYTHPPLGSAEYLLAGRDLEQWFGDRMVSAGRGFGQQAEWLVDLFHSLEDRSIRRPGPRIIQPRAVRVVQPRAVRAVNGR